MSKFKSSSKGTKSKKAVRVKRKSKVRSKVTSTSKKVSKSKKSSKRTSKVGVKKRVAARKSKGSKKMAYGGRDSDSKPWHSGKPQRVPKVVVFDLDNCCWDPEMYQMCEGPPFKYDQDTNECHSSRGRETVKLFDDISDIWYAIKTDPEFENTKLAIASCCDEPAWARQLFTHFRVGADKKYTMKQCIDHEEIHYGNKQGHLKQISKALGVELADMIFFDDQRGHITDANAIGVSAVQTPHGGVKWGHMQTAMQDLARAGHGFSPKARSRN